MSKENPTQNADSALTVNNVRLRVTPETKAMVTAFCDEFGVDADDALRDLFANYKAIRAGGFGGQLDHALEELSVLETLVGALTKTDLLILAELRNLQAAHYAAIATKMK